MTTGGEAAPQSPTSVMIPLPMLAGLAAAVGSFAATPLVIRLARSRGMYCMPGDRRIHREPVPRLGGVAILVGASVGLATALLVRAAHVPGWALGSPTALIVAGLVLGGAMVFVAGLVDDVRGIRPLAKVAVQLAAALAVYLLGFRIETVTLVGVDLVLGWLALPVTLLWIVGITNAYNLVDGMDGLATGMGMIAFAAIGAAAWYLGHGEVLVAASLMLGALAGFLPHNFSPARIFMGDSGSLFIGFALAVLSVQGSMKGTTAVLVVVPLFALAIPLLDTAAAMLRRWLRGLPISSADARHIHHRLVALGFSHRDAVLVLYIFAVGFASVGILLAFAPESSIVLISVLGGVASAAVLVIGMRGLRYDEFLLAGKFVACGPRRVRQVLRTKILANDLAQVIRVAGSMEEVQAVLEDAAGDLDLLHMEVCPASTPAAAGTDHHRFGGPGASWTLDFPLCHDECGRDRPVLRLHAPVRDEFRANSAESVAHALGAAIQDRFDLVSEDCGCAPASSWGDQPAADRQAAAMTA